MKRNDVIKWTAYLEIESVDLRMDEKKNQYALLKTSRKSRLLCWEKVLWERVQEDIEKEEVDFVLYEGHINQLMGNTFLVLDRRVGTRTQQLFKAFDITSECDV